MRFGGRRSLFSSHVSTEKVVIPLPEHEISFAHYEYYCSLAEITKAKENIDDFYEPDYGQISTKKNNARQLFRVAEEIGDFWEEYLTQRPNRFWNITLKDKKNLLINT